MMKQNQKLTTRRLCVLGMLLAVTVILSVFGTIRVGTVIKIPTKFISVFVAGALFGPWWSAAIGGIGDVLNCTLVPVGPILPLLTLTEALSGALYGIFFFGERKEKTYFIRVMLCVLSQAIIDIFLVTLILCHAGYFPNFGVALAIRLPASIIKIILQSVVLCSGKAYLPIFRKMI